MLDKIHHVKNGGQISGCGQYIEKCNGGYHVFCDFDNCCDFILKEDELTDYISDEWVVTRE